MIAGSLGPSKLHVVVLFKNHFTSKKKRCLFCVATIYTSLCTLVQSRSRNKLYVEISINSNLVAIDFFAYLLFSASVSFPISRFECSGEVLSTNYLL